MFSILNGTELKQWSTGNMLTNPHMNEGDKVRFVSGSGMVETNIAYTKDGTVVVDVPNRILTMDNSVYVELMGDHKCSANFDVVKQPKPNGYVLVDNKKAMPAVQPVTHYETEKIVPFEKTIRKTPGIVDGEDVGDYSAYGKITDTAFVEKMLAGYMDYEYAFRHEEPVDGVYYPATISSVTKQDGLITAHFECEFARIADFAPRMVISEDGSYVHFPHDGPDGAVTYIKISGEAPGTVVERIPEKFMPLLTDANGVKYKLTVSTSGALSAVKVEE